MQRPRPFAPWPRHVAQLGLLAGLALALANGAPTTVDAAPMPCQKEQGCTFKKPLFAFLLDYSSSMNEVMDGVDKTRWQAANAAISQAIAFDNGYIAEHFILALIRYGHDPDPKVPGSTIPTDTSGLVDGQKLDVPWYDPDIPQKPYLECNNGDAILAALAATDPPSGGETVGIGGWTRGALEFTADYIATTRADHPEDMGQRPAVVMLLMDGPWQNPQGNLNFAPPTENPNPSAAALFTEQGVPTYVVAFGTALDEKYPDDLALAGGTTAALHAATPTALGDALEAVIVDIQTDVVLPACAPGVPRIMLLLDASSSMLNINGGTQHAPPAMGGWDQIRDALAGDASMFDLVLDNNNEVEDLVHVGLAVFGHNSPEEQKLVVQYGPCRKQNIAWALDPATACHLPGCDDPYGGPPITWTFLDGSVEDPPAFADKTLSHMPKCDFNAQNPNACLGSGTFTHLGLNLIHDNLLTHRAECSKPAALFPCNDATQFLNILITDGKYNSTDAQVQLPLTAMLTAGVTTRVIGFGDAVDKAQLAQMADWGSGNLLDHHPAPNQDQLEVALKTILESLAYDPCCAADDCVGPPDPNSDDEGDPMPSETTSTSSETTADSTTAPTTTTGPSTTTAASATTTDSTTEPVPSTTTSVTTPTTDPTTTSDPTTPVPTSTPEPTTVPATTDTSSNTGPDESALVDHGCACDTRDPPTPLAPLLTLALLGLTRRRPRLPSPRSRATRPAAACRDCARSAPPPPAHRAPRSTSP
jgi:MYXO-CTERM domain-containing protein